MLARVLRWFGYCAHSHCYRERRALDGTGPEVIHFVCANCDYAVPAMKRSAEEHARILALARPATPVRTDSSQPHG